MMSEGMNSTRNFVFVVLVATQGIIGEKTTLTPIEGQTDDVLGLTTLSNRNGHDQERTGSTKHIINTTEEQTTRSVDINSSISYVYEVPTENNPESTKIARNSATTEEILENLETSDGEITTDISHHSPTSHTVEHSIRKDMSNNNEIVVSEKKPSDKKGTSKTPDNATMEDRYVILETTTEQPHSEPVETTAMNYEDDDIDDYVGRTTDEDTEKGTTDFVNEDDDIDITKFYRRMFEISHSLEDSNYKPETVAKTSTTITSVQDHSPLIHIERSHDPYRDNSRVSHAENNRESFEDYSRLSHNEKNPQSFEDHSHRSHNENNRQSYEDHSRRSHNENNRQSYEDHSRSSHNENNRQSFEDHSLRSHNENNRQYYEDHSRLNQQAKSEQSYDVRQNYPTAVTPLYIDTNIQPDPYLNSRSGQLFSAQLISGQSGSFENGRRLPQAHQQFNNNQRFIKNQPQAPQFMQQPFEQMQQQLQPQTHLYHPQQQQQQLQYPWPTVQPVPNHMDNILASLQQASLHPVLSAKQYKDFYEKQYIYPRNLF